jgi:hypothetical protein
MAGILTSGLVSVVSKSIAFRNSRRLTYPVSAKPQSDSEGERERLRGGEKDLQVEFGNDKPLEVREDATCVAGQGA